MDYRAWTKAAIYHFQLSGQQMTQSRIYNLAAMKSTAAHLQNLIAVRVGSAMGSNRVHMRALAIATVTIAAIVVGGIGVEATAVEMVIARDAQVLMPQRLPQCLP